MSKVIAMVGGKGGSGKSLLATSLSVEAIRAGKTVTLVDVDPQGTASRWSDRREAKEPRVVSAQIGRLDPTLADIDTDLIVIDSQGRASEDILKLARRADLILIPCRPTISDVETLADVIDILRLAKADAKVNLVWNACQSPADGRIAAGATLVENMGLTSIVPHVITQRVVHADSMVAGMVASEIDETSKAASEIGAVYSWVMERI